MKTKQARHNAKKREEAAKHGLKERRFYIHPDDKERVQCYIEKLNKERIKQFEEGVK